ncbi:MAG: hypothetical protein JSW07_16135, partial [bacterium]
MIIYRKTFYKTIVILFILFINFSFCKQRETITIKEQPAPQDSTRANVQEIMLNNQSEFEKNFDSLMQLIKEKEAELKKAELKLKRRSAEIKEKEQQLAKIEAEIRHFRKVTYFILVIGLVLVFIGLTLIFL